MNDKQRVAHYAAQQVRNGMIVGLGTGSTANFFIEELARRQNEEGLKVKVVSSSVVSANKAKQLGLSILGMEHIDGLDLYVDGADEVAPDLTLLKGRGYDLVREKLLAKAADSFLVLIDASKKVKRIGENFPIPIEVSPFAWRLVQRSVAAIGGHGNLRQTPNQDGLVVTSHGSLVLDVAFEPNLDGKTLNERLNAIPGIVEHGIFSGLTRAVFCGHDGKIDEQWA
ncbi:ribose-5-phosphate isomerase RpiA [Methylomonas sp. DH-1]|uniref:ribose-5-phosphate isomerase RpiA n=1 Tax=Methylomonas sp. (strain DH-1) TaxID=1727196 RepID=UPI0007C96FB2|nr:ribose-5-phosphate isomerase RpiA [Methylomonas sp. DH-1]ANE54555.1 ribose-5-phosphate isomerase [Methylomonas sp. DH-1]